VRLAALTLLGWLLAHPAAAQVTARDPFPAVSIRPFALITEQAFAAVDTFNATFGHSYGPFFGGGGQVLIHDRIVIEIGASRFQKDGQRAFRSNGVNYPLGIPLTTTITPLEITGGYRFRLGPHVRPYVAAGFGSWSYKETSAFADADENVDTRHAGFVLNGGAEFRLHRWIGVGVDAEYTHVPGILGQGGISQQAGESDLGGVAARVKLIVGR
jgi:opacity protein-like surface antigen